MPPRLVLPSPAMAMSLTLSTSPFCLASPSTHCGFNKLTVRAVQAIYLFIYMGKICVAVAALDV